ncbi:MAG TPA: D-alanyl-D-alanine carboxypeptidase/D-alanyl-D-alanine-endopeptidase [Candidatus Baltobacteraceae bacterium]|nr:D-alanyl-D-alanine carboxypeptidase/D-alanyl-D-alanine-endopeptidase [Candidatus Baltobacteraceae bacterium]
MKSSANYKSRSKRSRARKRRLGAALAGLLIVLAAVLVLRPRGHAAPAAPAAHPRSGTVASAMRRPAPAWGAGSRAELRDALRAAFAPALRGAQAWSCVVIAQDGSVLYDDNGSRAVTPASVQKLIVTDAALTDLGPRYRFDTLLAAAQPPRDGAVEGNLWLAGSGDPSLRSRDLAAGIEALRKDGVQTIRGGVAVDASAIAGEEINPLWNADDANEDFMAATSGASVDEDTVEFRVTGTQPGQAARVRIKLQSSDVHFYGSVETGGGDDVIVAATETPNEFRLAGAIPPGIEETFYVPVHGIDRYAGSVVAALVKRSGIALGGGVQTGTVPLAAQILWEHRSRALTDLLKHMLVFSDNHFAEQLMRTVGGQSGDTPDDADGLNAERAVLAQQGIPTPGLHIVDGSGLAHANRVAAITLARILARYDAAPAGNMLYPLLPRGGKDGTLKMYQFTTAQGRVRAKSGHVDGVSSLAGYVNTHRHGRVVFAFLINGSPGDPDAAIVSAVDRIAQR